MQRLEEDLEAEHQGADAAEGVVGVQVEERIERSGGVSESGVEEEQMLRLVMNGMQFNLAEYTAVGTAIASLQPHDQRRAPAATTPVVVVPLEVVIGDLDAHAGDLLRRQEPAARLHLVSSGSAPPSRLAS